jgi:uncharacterized protein YjeT (DUF2065 family)
MSSSGRAAGDGKAAQAEGLAVLLGEALGNEPDVTARRDQEHGSALGVAVIGTVLTARFTAALPTAIRARHDPRTVALAVAAPGRAHEVITAFVSGADAGLRVIGISVLVLSGLVVLQSLLSRPVR